MPLESSIPSTPWERAELGRSLRRAGLSYGEIAEVIPAAKATIAGWCKGIELTPEQKASIAERTGSRAGVPVDTQRARRLEVERIRTRARAEVAVLAGDPAWVAGLMLYWAEGTKTDNRLALTNSDPDLLRLFMWWVAAHVCERPRFVAHVVLHADNDEPAARSWWAGELGLATSDFIRSFVKPDGTGHRKNRLEQGVCQLRVRRSTDGLHVVAGWIEGYRELCRPGG